MFNLQFISRLSKHNCLLQLQSCSAALRGRDMALQEWGLSGGAGAAAFFRGLILASRRRQLLAGMRHALVLRRSGLALAFSCLGSLRMHGPSG